MVKIQAEKFSMSKKVIIPQINNTKVEIGYFYSYYCLIILFS